MPGVIVSRNNGGNNIPRDQSSWHVSSEVVGYDHGRKSMDNVVISDMFFIFNYVEFTQGKLRIARDTTIAC